MRAAAVSNLGARSATGGPHGRPLVCARERLPVRMSGAPAPPAARAAGPLSPGVRCTCFAIGCSRGSLPVRAPAAPSAASGRLPVT